MSSYFEPWRPTTNSVHLQGDFPAFSCHSQSAPVLLPGAGGTHKVLQLFQSASANGKTAASRSRVTKQDAQDAVLHVGGPVWAMGWCPSDVHVPQVDAATGPASRTGSVLAAQYLAVGCHPLQSRHNVLGKAVTGPALVQIWEATSPDQPSRQVQHGELLEEEDGAPALTLPEMVLGIVHDGGLTWSCQWCPDAELVDDLAVIAATTGQLPRLGLIAAALGDGTVRVWAVPQPRAVHQWYSCGTTNSRSTVCEAAESPYSGHAPLVALDPVALVSNKDLGGSMPAVIDWLPAKPHDLLLVGCWDGNVAIIKLTPSGSSSSHPPCPHPQQQQQQQSSQQGASHVSGSCAAGGWEVLSFFPAEPIAVRAVQWIPPAVCRVSEDLVHRHVFLSAGHAGGFNVWDDRDQFQPLYHQILTTTTVLNAAWTTAPFGALVALEDASLRGIPLDTQTIIRNGEKNVLSVTWRGPGMGALWALDVHPTLQLVAYGGEDGEVGVFAAEYEASSKRRAAHTPVAGLAKEADVFVIKTAQQMLSKHSIYNGKIIERQPALKGSRFPDEMEAIHRVAWWPGGRTAAWLASGGAAGLVRLQWVQKR